MNKVREVEARLLVRVVCERLREPIAESVGVAIVLDVWSDDGLASSNYEANKHLKVRTQVL